MKIIIYLLCFALFGCAYEMPKPRPGEYVILLHGLARTHRAMGKISEFLKSKGYHVINFGYASTRKKIEDIAQNDLPRALAQCPNAQKIHFVTHSMGGIVLRYYLQNYNLPKGSRIVMLSPPNQGSELVDYLKDLWIYKWRNGPAGGQLGTDLHSIPKTLKPIDGEIGIITGDFSLNPLFSNLIPGPDDGKVSVKRAKLKEMTDFIVISASHTFIMQNAEAMAQTAYFLENGRFK